MGPIRVTKYQKANPRGKVIKLKRLIRAKRYQKVRSQIQRFEKGLKIATKRKAPSFSSFGEIRSRTPST